MNIKPEITVVTVCRNALEALKLTTESVRAQNFGSIEHLIIDGASTDGTVEWLSALPQSAACATVWHSESDAGIYDAMNKGIERARGEWVIFMNAGDIFAAPDTISRVFGGKTYDGAGVVYGDVIKKRAVGELHGYPAGEPRNTHRMFYCHQCAFARRAVLAATPFDIRHRMSADICQVKQMLKKGVKFVHVNIPVAIFDTSGVSNTRRSAGLRDNISVVMENDPWPTRLKLLPRLLVPYIMCKLRGK